LLALVLLPTDPPFATGVSLVLRPIQFRPGQGGAANPPSVFPMAEPSLLKPSAGAMLLSFAVGAALAALGLAGLVQLPLEPPLSGLAAREPAASPAAPAPSVDDADLLANLDRLEDVQQARQEATLLLSRFVGAEITRFLWGGFSDSLDVLGLEAPEAMAVRLTLPAATSTASSAHTANPASAVAASPFAASVQLELRPHQGGERFVARVVAAGSVPHGVACRGGGPLGAFVLQGDQLRCPPGWQELPFQLARR